MDNLPIVFGAAWLGSALCGLAVLLRSEAPLTLRLMSATVLYNGLLGLSICLIGYEWLGRAAWLTLGVSMLSGLAGVKAADVLTIVLRKIGVALKATITKDE